MENLRKHSWSDGATPHEIIQDGQVILHHRCLNCGRDFAKEEGDEFWRAAHVGLLKIDFLPEAVNEQWIGEGCPGEMRASDQANWKSRNGRTLGVAGKNRNRSLG